MRPALRLLPRVALLGALLAPLVGCFEAELELQLLPGGQGVLRLSVELPREQLAPGGDEAALARAANAHLAAWQGVDAWTERDLLLLPAEDPGAGRVRVIGTAWCRDVRRLRPPLPWRLQLEERPPGLSLELGPGLPRGCVALDEAAWASERARLLDREGALGPARCRLRLLLPGAVGELQGGTGQGQRVERSWEGERVREALRDLVGEVELLRGRVAAGALTPEQAAEREAALGTGRLSLSLRCALPAGGDPAQEALFARALAAAEEAWTRARAGGDPASGDPAGGAPADPLAAARRDMEEAQADSAAAEAEVERWRRELEALEAENEEEGLVEEAEADPRHARLRVELLDAPPGVSAQVLAQPAGEGLPQGAALGESGRWDAPALDPGSWRIAVLARLDGVEWTFLRRARLGGGSFARVGFVWPRGEARISGKTAPGPGRVARAWSPELQVAAPVGPDGSFSLGPLPPGRWTVAVTEGEGPWIEDPAQLPAKAEVTLGADQALQVAPPGVSWDGQHSRVLWE